MPSSPAAPRRRARLAATSSPPSPRLRTAARRPGTSGRQEQPCSADVLPTKDQGVVAEVEEHAPVKTAKRPRRAAASLSPSAAAVAASNPQPDPPQLPPTADQLAAADAAHSDAAADGSAVIAPAEGTKLPRKRRTKPTAAAASITPPDEGPQSAAPATKPRKKAAAAAGPTRGLESKYWAEGHALVAGVDEAGRGPLAGPVVAAACCIPAHVSIPGLDDSKKMTEEEREAAYALLTTHPEVVWAVSVISRQQIDELNILQATMAGMEQAVAALPSRPGALLVDGNRLPAQLQSWPAVQAVVGGDGKSTCIAAASIIAKVTRDRLMVELDKQFPQYGFAQHKGYGVPAHLAALKQHGPCQEHRRSFEPVKTMTGWSRPAQQQAAGSTARKGKGRSTSST